MAKTGQWAAFRNPHRGQRTKARGYHLATKLLQLLSASPAPDACLRAQKRPAAEQGHFLLCTFLNAPNYLQLLGITLIIGKKK